MSLDDTHYLMAALLLAVVAGIALQLFWASFRPDASKRKDESHPARHSKNRNDRAAHQIHPPVLAPTSAFDAADQLRIVMAASFSAQPLLNKAEARVFHELEAIVAACNPRWLVMAQVSLGEILRSQDADAYRCINSKRVDLLLADDDCQPRHVIEYQGRGHHQGTAAARDAVKKEALRRAGIGYHEVVAGHTTPSELKRLVQRMVDAPPDAVEPDNRPASSVRG